MDSNYNKTRMILIGNAIIGLAIISMSIALLKGSGFYDPKYSGLWGSAIIYGALIASGRAMKYNQDVTPYRYLGGASAVVSLVAAILHIVRINDDVVKSWRVACKLEGFQHRIECDEIEWAYPLLIVVMILFFVNVIVSGVGVFFAHKASTTAGTADAVVH